MDDIINLIKKVEELKSNKNFSEALNVLQEALSKYSDDYRIYEEIADIYLYEGKFLKAKKAIDFALNINPESATGNYLKGFILLSNNKIIDAIKFLDKSNLLMPNNAEVLRNLGWAYSMTGEQDKGVFILKRALNISPNDKLIYEDLAVALIGMGNIEEGNAILEKIGKQKVFI